MLICMGCSGESVEVREERRAEEWGVGDDAKVAPEVLKTPDAGHDARKGSEEGAVGNAGADTRMAISKSYQSTRTIIRT